MRRLRLDPGSARLAFYLIALVAVQTLISAIVPQRDLAVGQIIGWRRLLGQDNRVITALWLDRIYYSPLFLASLALLGVNLLTGNLRRFRTVLKVERTLLRARHLGSIVFHLAILVVIAGVLLNNLYRFRGVLGVTEGQTVRDVPADYVRLSTGYLRRDAVGRYSLTLDRLDRNRLIGDAATEEATVTLHPSDGGPPVAGPVRVNHPLRWGGLEFHMGSRPGYSPEVVVQDADRRPLYRRFVRLKVAARGQEKVHEDYFMLPDGKTMVGVNLIPSDRDPGVVDRRLTVKRSEAVLFEGPLAAGDTLAVADLRITIPRVRNWCYLQVEGNPMLWMVFSGFWLGLGGLAISVVARVKNRREKRS